MRDGFVKVGCASNDVVVANPELNTKSIIKIMNKANKENVNVLVFPELAISGYTCGDLFFQDTLLDSCLEGLEKIRLSSLRKNMLVVVGLPLKHNNKVYNVAAFINKGKILGFVPKTHIPNYNEFYEARHFNKALKETTKVLVNNKEYLLGTNLLFKCKQVEELIVAGEICEDLWVPLPPSIHHALNGATVICNLSASNELVGKDKYRLELVKTQSSRLVSAYLYSSAGEGESTQDAVYSSHNIIAENGNILKEGRKFKNDLIISEIDVKKLAFDRSKKSTFISEENLKYDTIYFDLNEKETSLTRGFPTSTI